MIWGYHYFRKHPFKTHAQKKKWTLSHRLVLRQMPPNNRVCTFFLVGPGETPKEKCSCLLGWFWLLFFDLQSWRSYNTCTQWNHIKHVWPNACSIIISWYLCNKSYWNCSLFTILVQAMIPTNLRFSPCALGSGSAFFALIQLVPKLGHLFKKSLQRVVSSFFGRKPPVFFFLTIILWFYD